MLNSPINAFRKRYDLAADAFDGTTVLVMPENLDKASTATELLDTDDGIFLSKYLKSQGVKCKTAYDLGLRPKIFDRRGGDIWLGIVWIVENLAAPTIAGVLSAYLMMKHQNDDSSTVHLDLRIQDGDRTSEMKLNGSMPHILNVLAGLKQMEYKSDDDGKG